MNINIKICRRCGEPFDIGTNFEWCPECRKKERDKLKERKV